MTGLREDFPEDEHGCDGEEDGVDRVRDQFVQEDGERLRHTGVSLQCKARIHTQGKSSDAV